MGLWDRLMRYIDKHGIVRFMIIVYCACIIYIIGFILYQIFRYVHSIGFKKFDLTAFEPIVNKVPLHLFLEPLLRAVFNVCLSIVWFLTGIFLIMYVIYAAARLILMDWLLIAIFKPFKDCKDLGVFDLFDGLVKVFFSGYTLGHKFREIVIATGSFIKKFFGDTFDVIYPGYIPNVQFVDAIIEFVTEKCSEGRKSELMDIMSSTIPIIKINFTNNESDDLDALQVAELEKCIKTRMIHETGDENTVDRLRIILTNSISKRECMTGLKELGNMVGNAFSSSKNADIDSFGKTAALPKEILD